MPDEKLPREILPIPVRKHVGLTTFDAKDRRAGLFRRRTMESRSVDDSPPAMSCWFHPEISGPAIAARE
jgi:hypothetical protein